MRAGPTATRPDRTTHDCPGCKKRAVPRHQLSCKPCWYRLPKDLRDRLNNAFHRDPGDHLAAMTACLNWYDDNPPAVR